MCTYGDVGDLIPSLRCDNILTAQDQYEIKEQSLNYRMIKLLDILHSRLQSLDPLRKAMKETPQTYNDALQLLTQRACSTMHVHSSGDQEELVQEITELLKKFYLNDNQNFRPCYNQRPRTLEDVWVDVEIDTNLGPADVDGQADVDSPQLSDYQKCLPGQNRKSSIFKASRLVICLGQPGSGKTTLTRKIGVDWASRNPQQKSGLRQYDLVLIVILKKVTKDAKNIWEMAVEYFASQERLKEHKNSVLRLRDLEGWLIRSHPLKARESDLSTLVVLDGYDEMKATCEELEQALFDNTEEMPFGYDVLVTSRPYKLAMCPVPHEIVYMRPLDNLHRIEFVEKYYGCGELAKKLNELVDENSHLEELSRNPLLLNFICMIYGADRGAFSESTTKCELYEKLFEHLIRQWKNKTNDSHFDVQNWKNHPCIEALARLSFMHLLSTEEDYRFYFTQEELGKCVLNEEIDASSGCQLLLEIGLIQNQGQCGGQKLFSHWHTSFIEFAAAMWLALVLKSSPLTAQMPKDVVSLKGQTYSQLLRFYDPWKFVEVAEFLAEMAIRNECPREGAAKLISLFDPRVNVAAHLDQAFSLPLPLDVSWSMLHLLAIRRIFGFQALFEYMCHKIDYKNLSLMKGLLKGDGKEFGQHMQYFDLRPEVALGLNEGEHPGVSLLMCVEKDENIVSEALPSTLRCDYCIVSTHPGCIQEFYQIASRYAIGHLHIQVVGSLLSVSDDNLPSSDEEAMSTSSGTPPVQSDGDGMLKRHFSAIPSGALMAKDDYDHRMDPFDHVTIAPLKSTEIAVPSASEETKPVEKCRVSLSFSNKSVEPQPIKELMEDISSRLSHPIDEIDIYGQETVLTDLIECLQFSEPQIVVLSDISLSKEEWRSFVKWVSYKNLTRITLNKCNIGIDALHDLAANSQNLECLCLSRISTLRWPKKLQKRNLQKFLKSWQTSIKGHRLLTGDDLVQLIFCNGTLSESQQEMANKFFKSSFLSESATLVMFNNEWLPEHKLHNAAVPRPDLRKTPKNYDEYEEQEQVVPPQKVATKHVKQNIVWLLGGYSSDANANPIIEIYNPIGPTIGSLTHLQLKTPRRYHNCVLVHDKLYIIGGLDKSYNYLDSVEVFVPSSNIAINCSLVLKEKRCFAATTTKDGYIFVFGGRNPSALSSSEFLNVSHGVFESLAPMPSTRSDHTAECIGDCMYLIGGNVDGPNSSNSVLVYDPATNKYNTNNHNLLEKIYWHASVVEESTIVVTGGWDGSKPLSSSERYDPRDGNKSMRLADMKEVRHGHALVNIGGQLVAIGGEQLLFGPYLDSIEVYDSRMDKWTESETKLLQPRAWFGAVVV